MEEIMLLMEDTHQQVVGAVASVVVVDFHISTCNQPMKYLETSLEAKIHLLVSLMMMTTFSVVVVEWVVLVEVSIILVVYKVCKWVEEWEVVARRPNKNNPMIHLHNSIWVVV